DSHLEQCNLRLRLSYSIDFERAKYSICAKLFWKLVAVWNDD
ncbi:22517_t:CDS:1, partial [Cetraspora pellucida]